MAATRPKPDSATQRLHQQVMEDAILAGEHEKARTWLDILHKEGVIPLEDPRRTWDQAISKKNEDACAFLVSEDLPTPQGQDPERYLVHRVLMGAQGTELLDRLFDRGVLSRTFHPLTTFVNRLGEAAIITQKMAHQWLFDHATPTPQTNPEGAPNDWLRQSVFNILNLSALKEEKGIVEQVWWPALEHTFTLLDPDFDLPAPTDEGWVSQVDDQRDYAGNCCGNALHALADAARQIAVPTAEQERQAVRLWDRLVAAGAKPDRRNEQSVTAQEKAMGTFLGPMLEARARAQVAQGGSRRPRSPRTHSS